jgi:hypothetical protein
MTRLLTVPMNSPWIVSRFTYVRLRVTHGSSYQVELDIFHENLLVEPVFLDEHIGRFMGGSIWTLVVGLLIIGLYLDEMSG